MTDLAYYLFVLMGLIVIYGFFIMINQKHIFERYEKDNEHYNLKIQEIVEMLYAIDLHDGRIIDRLDNISYDLDKIRNNKKILLTAADRGKIDEIIMALTTLGEEKMISYTEEIEFLLKLRNL